MARSEHEIMGTKTRLNYPSGGWCGRMFRGGVRVCVGDCAKCWKFSEYKEKR